MSYAIKILIAKVILVILKDSDLNSSYFSIILFYDYEASKKTGLIIISALNLTV